MDEIVGKLTTGEPLSIDQRRYRVRNWRIGRRAPPLFICFSARPYGAAQRVDLQSFFGGAMGIQSESIGEAWTPASRYETHRTH